MQTTSPYLQLPSVGISKRIINCIIDLILIFIIADILKHTLLNPYFETFSQHGVVGSRAFLAVSLSISFLYYLIWESACGRTPGKFATHTVVISENGELPSFLAAFYRSLCRFIPFEFISFVIHEGVGWHDTIPHTRVVDAKEYKKVKS